MINKTINHLFFIFLILSSYLLTSCSVKNNYKIKKVKFNTLFFMAYGRVFTIDTNDTKKQDISFLCAFHTTAPCVDISSEGLFFARISSKNMAVFDPLKKKFTATIPLQYRIYNHIITPNHKAYVTHHTLTSKGFTISVIDTYKKKFKEEIQHISGLRTDLAQGNNFVYLTTLGVDKDEYIYLYEINTKNNHLQEIYKTHKKGYYWKIAINNNHLYLSHIYTKDNDVKPIIQIMDLSNKTIFKSIRFPVSSKIKKILGKITFTKKEAFLPCYMSNNKNIIVSFDPFIGTIKNIYPIKGKIYKIIGIKNQILYYIDNPMQVGKAGISLYFYDLKKKKEVKIINIKQFLKNI